MQVINFDLGSSLLQNPAGTPSLGATVPGTYVSKNLQNIGRRGVKLFINVSAAAGTYLTVTIQGIDLISGLAYPLLTSAALGVGQTTLTIYPGIASVANQSLDDILPTTWNVSCVVATGNVTATIGGSLIV
jgi:hypothetical protein